MSEEEKALKLDIAKVLRQQKHWFLRNMPRVLVRLLERIIHQDEINALLLRLKDVKGFDFVRELQKAFDLRTEVMGAENLPSHNRLIFTLNHSMGALEGIASLTYLQERYPDIKLLANNLLTNIKNARSFMLPVTVFSKTDRSAMAKIAEAYESETNIYTFPAGNVSRIFNGKVRDREWHRSFVENARKYQRKVVPIFIENVNSKLFYRIYQVRKFLRIGANIELFFLPHEMFKGRGQIIRLRIGKPIPHTAFTDQFSSHEWAQRVREHIYGFETDYNRVFS